MSEVPASGNTLWLSQSTLNARAACSANSQPLSCPGMLLLRCQSQEQLSTPKGWELAPCMQTEEHSAWELRAATPAACADCISKLLHLYVTQHHLNHVVY